MSKLLTSIPTMSLKPPISRRQLSIERNSIQLPGITAPEQAKVHALLANILMQAAGVAERDDGVRIPTIARR